jgi:hypothetical protein
MTRGSSLPPPDTRPALRAMGPAAGHPARAARYGFPPPDTRPALRALRIPAAGHPGRAARYGLPGLEMVAVLPSNLVRLTVNGSL